MDTSLQVDISPDRVRRLALRRLVLRLVCPILLISAAVIALLRFGGYLLVASDPLPRHSQAAAVLQGDFLGERARIAGAMRLLSQGTTDHVLVSMPEKTFWDQSAPAEARAYFEQQYGKDLSSRVDFCVVSSDTDSTEDEAWWLRLCLLERGWRSVIIVTSDYHTRRAGLIWRRVVAKDTPPFRLSVYGVTDPEFNRVGWWRERRSAKTWIQELAKLAWTVVFRKEP